MDACRVVRGAEPDPIACIDAIRAAAQPGWLTIVNRAAIAASGVYVIATAVAVGYEMRSSTRLAVHPQPIWIGAERRVGPIERRANWPPPEALS
jgi:hypothetical protein